MEKYTLPHIRLGGTSFLLHEEYVPALRFAAARCEDIALLLLQAGRVAVTEHGAIVMAAHV